MREPLPEPLRGRPFRVSNALDLGIPRRRLDGSDLTAPFWGVRSGPAGTVLELAHAFAARMQDGSFYSHVTAAVLHDIPLPPHLTEDARLHVSTPAAFRGPTGAGTVGHHLHIDDRDLTSIDGLPVTTPARTVFDLAGSLSEESLLAALDNIRWWRREPQSRETLESIAAALSRFKGQRGRRSLTEMIPLSTDRSDSRPESAFRLRFIRAGFPDPEPNRKIYGVGGRFIAMPDLQFREFRMALDYEGDHHRTDKHQWQKDLARVPRLQDENWHHTRLSAADLANDREVMARIRRVLRERGWNT